MLEGGGFSCVMRKIRILHAADLHLDSPFESLNAEKAALRRREQRQLLMDIAALAREREADLLLLAGDVLDGAAVYRETADALREALKAVPCPVFIAPGNHDYYTPTSLYARETLGENIHIFKEDSLSCVELPELGARVWGAAFTDTYAAFPADFRAEKREDVLDIAVLHGTVGQPDSGYRPISEAALAESGFDYTALGHVHACSGLRRAGNGFYAWPGCPMGRGFDEVGEKGVLFVEAAPGDVSAEFVPLGARRYEILRVDVSESEDALSAVLSALPEDAERHIFRILLTGEREYAPDLRALQETLAGRCWQLQLRDETVLRRDIWEKAGEDTLQGLFLKKLREKYENAAPEERRRIMRAARWGIQAFENGEELG